MTRNDPSFERKNQPEIYAFFEDLKGPMQRTQFLAISRRRKKETHLNFSWEYEHIWKWGPHLGHTDWFLSVCYQWWHVLKHIKTRYKKATYIYSGWWFGTCFVLPYIGKNHPNWLSYFLGVGIPPSSFFLAGIQDSPWMKNHGETNGFPWPRSGGFQVLIGLTTTTHDITMDYG